MKNEFNVILSEDHARQLRGYIALEGTNASTLLNKIVSEWLKTNPIEKAVAKFINKK